ncbi:MAG: PAS domain-containing protein [Elusimicrobia bacterium]|nr:PAS domain-containing protein [Elusimicrobiota bacterium]
MPRAPKKSPKPKPSARRDDGLPMRLEEFFAGLLDSTNLVIYLKDASGRYVYVNRRYEAVSGAPRGLIIGKTDKDLFPPEVADLFAAQDAEVARRRAPVEYEETLTLLTGVRSFITEKFPLIGADGRVFAVGGFCTETTTQKHRADESRAAERERLAATLRCIGDGVVSTDTAGQVLLMNPTAERLTGLACADAVGRPVDEVLRPAEPARAGEAGRLVAAAAASGLAASSGDLEIVSADALKRRVALTAAPVRDRAGGLIGAVLTARDVTEQARLEAEVFQARKLESLGLLAGGIAHDFNNLLTGILGNLSIARQSAGAPAELESALAETEAAARTASRLTQQLLTFAKGGAPVRRVIDAAPTVREAATFASRGSASRCVFDFAPDPWPVSADPGQLGQVVSNLVINAVQAMPDGGTIIIGLCNEDAPADGAGPCLRLTVSDGGPGIAPDHLDRIFDPYFTTKEKGTGLGLTTCYAIVAKHDGRITVASRPGEGATFTIRLPALPGRAPDEAADRLGLVWRGSGRILAMDDDPLVLGFLARMLPMLGFAVALARDGAEAVARFRAARDSGAPFDAVILDLTVPGGMGGRDALKELRRLDPRVRAIVSSGYSSDPVLAEFKKHGFRAALPKPYSAQQLSQVLHDLLAEPSRR